MLIAIDYDGTITADPEGFALVARVLHDVGHNVIICTGRAFPPQGLEATGIPVFCTAGQAKRDYLAALGHHPDVWIDDDPQSILIDDPSTV